LCFWDALKELDEIVGTPEGRRQASFLPLSTPTPFCES